MSSNDVRAASFSQPKEKTPMSNKIALPIAELKPALTGLGKVIKKHSLPVLDNIKVERTSEGWIALTATDLDSFATVRLEQPTEGEPTAILVPYEQLQRAVKACTKNETITVHPTFNNTGFLQYGIAEVKFESLPVAEFPAIPRIQGQAIPLPDSLRTSIREALECASTDHARIILNSAHIDVSQPKAQYVVGTNGSHLYASNSFSLPLKESIILPSHPFLDFKGFSADGEWQLKVANGGDKFVQITSRRWRYISKQHSGVFPNWRHVVPKDFTSSIEIQDAAALIHVIEQLSDYDGMNHRIGLFLENGALALLTKADRDDPWTKTAVSNAKVTGKNARVFVNREYLTKALHFGLNLIKLTDEISSVKMHNEGRQMIVMPVRAEDSATQPPKPAANGTEEHQPAAPAASTEGNTTMPKNNGNGSHQEPAAEKPTLEKALADIEKIKGSYREAIRGLNDLTDTLKAISKERKSTEKEVQSVRSTLERLQSVRL
jgi:DNA polymerase III sliding clamp (beta) subunit (PCNA family)